MLHAQNRIIFFIKERVEKTESRVGARDDKKNENKKVIASYNPMKTKKIIMEQLKFISK